MKSFTGYSKSTGKHFGDQTQPRFSVSICCREIIFALPSDKITDCLPDQGDEIVKGKESIALKVYDPTGGLIYNKRVTPTYGNCFPTFTYSLEAEIQLGYDFTDFQKLRGHHYTLCICIWESMVPQCFQ